MPSDDLEKLIRRAEAGWVPPSAEGLGDRVRGLAQRRRRRARMACAAAACLLLLGAGLWRWGGPGGDLARHTPPPPPAPVAPALPPALTPPGADDLPALKRRLAHIQLEADIRQSAVNAVLQRQRLGRLQRQLAGLTVVDPVQRQIELAARVLLDHADRLENQPALRRAGLDAYRQLIAQFPETPSAEYARRHLAEIQPASDESKGESL